MEPEEPEEEVPQRLLRFIEGDVDRPEFLLLGQAEALLPDLGDEGEVPGDVQLHIGRHRGHPVPLGEDLQKVKLHLEHQVGEAGHRLLQRGHHGVQPRSDGSQVLGGPHKALVIHTIPPGPAGDLLDLLRAELPALHPVKLFRVHENHPADGEVEPHADGIGGHHIPHLPGQEALHLPPPGGVGQGAVDDGGLLPRLAQVLRHAEDPHLGKGDEGIPRLDPGVVHRVVHAHQGSLAPVPDDFVAVPAAFDEAHQQVLGLWGSAQVDLRRLDA